MEERLMLPRHLIDLLQFELQGAADEVSRGTAEAGRELLRAGLQRTRSEVPWEAVLLLAGLAVVWWSMSELIDLSTAPNPVQGLQAAEAYLRRQCRGFLIAISGLFGLVAMFWSLTLGFLEMMVSREVSKERAIHRRAESRIRRR
jgi:hypothetical protein